MGQVLSNQWKSGPVTVSCIKPTFNMTPFTQSNLLTLDFLEQSQFAPFEKEVWAQASHNSLKALYCSTPDNSNTAPFVMSDWGS